MASSIAITATTRLPSSARSVVCSIGSESDSSSSFAEGPFARYARDVKRITRKIDMPDSLYTPQLAERICKRIAEGESLRAICRDPGMPTEGAVRAWARDNRDEFRSRYRLARELQLEYWADQIVEIADASESDPRDRQVRIDTRKWL